VANRGKSLRCGRGLSGLQEPFGTPDGYATLILRWFEEMFTVKSNAAVVASALEGGLTKSLADLRVPVMALQTTYSNEKRKRRAMSKGQTTSYLDMLRARVPSVRIEIIDDIGHFPRIDESGQTNALLDSFLASLGAS
jgi:pimeloyl-ACP methyl ester carboxylesterase